MKGQVKAMSDDDLSFWTSVLSSWVKGDWWKTISTAVIVALIVLLCGPWILQCIMNFVTLCWCHSPKLAVREPGCNISLWMMLILWVKSVKRVDWRRKQIGSILKAGLPRLWTLSYMPSIYGNDIPTGKPGPQKEEPQGSPSLKEYPNFLCNQIESYILLCLLGYDHRPIDNCPLWTTEA